MKVPRLLLLPAGVGAASMEDEEDGVGITNGVSVSDCDAGAGAVGTVAVLPGAVLPGAMGLGVPGSAALPPTGLLCMLEVVDELSCRPSACRMQSASSDTPAHRPMKRVGPEASCAFAAVASATAKAAASVALPMRQSLFHLIAVNRVDCGQFRERVEARPRRFRSAQAASVPLRQLVQRPWASMVSRLNEKPDARALASTA